MLLLLFIPKIMLYIKKQQKKAQEQASGVSRFSATWRSVRSSQNSESQHDNEGMKYVRHGPETQAELNEYKRKVQIELYQKLKSGCGVDLAFQQCGIEPISSKTIISTIEERRVSAVSSLHDSMIEEGTSALNDEDIKEGTNDKDANEGALAEGEDESYRHSAIEGGNL